MNRQWDMVIEPVAGLGNRLLALSSLLKIESYRNDLNLILLWQLENSCKVSFEDLFEFHTTNVRVVNIYNTGKSNIIRSFFGKCYRNHLLSKCNHVYYWKDICEWNGNVKEIIKKLNSNNTFIQAYLEVVPIENSDFTWIKLSESVKKRGEAVLNGITKDIVGVHIRRTDHKEAIINSPTWLFVEEMKLFLSNMSDTHFYLATDDVEVEEEIKSIFGDRVMVNTRKVFNRDSKEGVQDGLIDLMALSKCKLILGSYNSSFSRVASIIGNVPLKTIELNAKSK